MKISKAKLQRLINESYKKIIKETIYVNSIGQAMQVGDTDPYEELVHPKVREKISREEILEDIEIANTAMSLSVALRNDPSEDPFSGEQLQKRMKVFDNPLEEFDRQVEEEGVEEEAKKIEEKLKRELSLNNIEAKPQTTSNPRKAARKRKRYHMTHPITIFADTFEDAIAARNNLLSGTYLVINYRNSDTGTGTLSGSGILEKEEKFIFHAYRSTKNQR